MMVSVSIAGSAYGPEGGPDRRYEVDTGNDTRGLAIQGDAVWAVSFGSGRLMRIRPADSVITDRLTPGPSIATVLGTQDALWLGAQGGPSASRVFRVDPATRRVVAEIETGDLCCELSEGAGSIWALERTWNVVRIDTQTNKVVGRFPVTVDPSAKRVNAVFGGDSVWFSGGPTLTRIRVADGTTEQIDTGGGVPLRARAGLMWGASAKELWALDMASGKVVRRIPVSALDVVSLNLDDDSIWVGVLRTSRTGALLRLDQASGAVRGEFGGLTYPARIEIGFGSVWVADPGKGSVFRVEATDSPN
jgi:hypothetical protein